MKKIDFDQLVSEYKNKVYNTCLGFVKNQEDAEDLAQEVFIEVYKKLDAFRGDSKIGTWLYRLAVNKSLEQIRREGRKKRSTKKESFESASTLASGSFYHPGVQLENKERAAILFGAMDMLPENQKVAFTLQKVEGLSVDEISQVMEKNEGAIESLLSRAKENLRKKLKDYYESQ